MVVTGAVTIITHLLMQKLTNTLSSGPMLAAGNELATAASEALGIEMKFEDISVYVHPPKLASSLSPKILRLINSTEPRRSVSSSRSRTATSRSCSISSSTTVSCVKARQTTSPRQPFTTLQEGTRPSPTNSSACIRTSYDPTKRLSAVTHIITSRQLGSYLRGGDGDTWALDWV